MGDNLQNNVKEKMEDGVESIVYGSGVNPIYKAFGALGSLILPPLATAAYSKNQAIKGFKDSGALGKLKQVGLINDSFFEDQKLSPEEEAAESVQGSFKKTRLYRAETKFWDMLYDEPCWINPATGHFELGTAFSTLWCTWFMEDDPTKQVETLMGTKGTFFKSTVDEEKLRIAYKKKYKIEDDDFLGGIGTSYDEKFYDALGLYLGTHYVTADGDIDFVRKPPPAPVDSAAEIQPTPFKNDERILAKNLGLSVKEVKECIQTESLGPLALLGQTPSSLIDVASNEVGETLPHKCNMGKWFFCFFMKFLLGPAGLLILKFMPYVVQLFLNIWNFFGKLFLGLTNGVRYIFRYPMKPLVYIDQFNKPVENYYPDPRSTILTYIGLVFPWKFFSHSRGQKHGNGEFGKFILSLMLLSVGLITMGSITIVMFLLVLSFYLVKTLTMFTSNIDTKKKK